jgi:RNA polymerase sigma factor (sigma-70 family)
LRGDEAQLFRTHHRRLLRLVARDVSARPQVIEDACAFAWLELVARQPERANIVGWLRVVARHEALRLARHDRCAGELALTQDERASAAAERALAAREALAVLAALPARKRAVLTLQVSGHSYAEIAAALQMTHRTVERQLLRARARVRSCRGDEPGLDERS